MPIRMLLLQARMPDDPMARHEHECFVTRVGLDPESIVPHDLCAGPPSPARLARFDALSVGGSGDFYVSSGNLPRFAEYLDFLRELVASGPPTFASCFGYQSLVRALGGEVVHDPSRREVGTYELVLSEEGRADPLFGTLPDKFQAQLGHKDRVRRPAPGLLNLASSERAGFQALRVPDRPVWATQFHPELDRATNLDRFRRYVADYATSGDRDDLTKAEARFAESPEASDLLRRFIALVFG